MDNKVYATLFERVTINEYEEVYLFIPVTYLEECEFNYKEEILIDKIGRNYYSINSDINDKYFYGYPLTLEQLKDNYKDVPEENLLTTYFEAIQSNIYLGKQNLIEKVIDIIEIPNETMLDICFEEDLDETEYQSRPYLNEEAIDFMISELEKNNLEKVLTLLKGVKKPNNVLNIFTEPCKSTKQTKEKKQKQNVENNLIEIENMIGLDTIKEKLYELSTYLNFINKVTGMAKLERPNLNMIFVGNPGTGKTTVARIIAKLLYKMGYVNCCFSEVSSKSLISGYIGQTATKTAELIEQNKGGVIFVDEAYALATVSSNKNFSQDALAEILKEMEKNETVFIFAGYKNEMQDFLEMNSGLNSRIGYFLEFNDYSLEELLKMLKQKIELSGLNATNEFYTKASYIIEEAKKQKNFGNGRFIDKLFSRVLLKHATNNENTKDFNLLLTIKENDLPDDILNDLGYNSEKKVGFQMTK